MSPELLYPERFGARNGRPTKQSDCYALGMVIYEVLSGQIPFAQLRDRLVVTGKVIEGERPERPPKGVLFTDDLWATMESCWSPKPNYRPTVEVVFKRLIAASATWQPPPPNVGGDLGIFRHTLKQLLPHTDGPLCGLTRCRYPHVRFF
jgi:serine/threonine protein kinase